MLITGSIHYVNLDKKILSMIIKKRQVYFYLQNNLIKKFKKFLTPNKFITVDCKEEMIKYGKYKAYPINHFVKIVRNNRRAQEVFYDLDIIRDGIRALFNSFNHVMFLDLEMTMPFYDDYKHFKSEIIQAGIVLCDKEGKIILKEKINIRPTLYKKISQRTLNFLKARETIFLEGVPFFSFYQKFEEIITNYQPTILVWGKNDILALNSSYILNELPEITGQFVNFIQIQKNYFNLKNDLGLVNAYKIYTKETIHSSQKHDALEDAEMTYMIYKEFISIINQEKEFDFPKG